MQQALRSYAQPMSESAAGPCFPPFGGGEKKKIRDRSKARSAPRLAPIRRTTKCAAASASRDSFTIRPAEGGRLFEAAHPRQSAKNEQPNHSRRRLQNFECVNATRAA